MATKTTKTTTAKTTAAKATPAKAEEVKATAAKVEAVKTEVKEEVKATPAKKTATKATAEKKTAEKKTATEKKTTAAEKKAELFVQFSGHEFSYEELVEKVKADYIAQTGKKTISSTKLYLKPEDMTVYYVVNEKFLGHVYLG